MSGSGPQPCGGGGGGVLIGNGGPAPPLRLLSVKMTDDLISHMFLPYGLSSDKVGPWSALSIS